MKNITSLLFAVIFLSSCSYNNKLITYDKSNYIISPPNYFIQANYNNTEEINPKSNIKLAIKNNTYQSIFIFSTVLQNENMFYSKNNFLIKNNKIELNSFYKNHMEDAAYSGIRKYNFIPIIKGDSLIININEKQIPSNVKKVKLIYYFIPNIEKDESLLNMKKYKILKGSIEKNIK